VQTLKGSLGGTDNRGMPRTGYKHEAKRLATVVGACQLCEKPATHLILWVRRQYRVFFVPAFPVKTRYVATCTSCGRYVRVHRKEALDIVRRAKPREEAPAGVFVSPERVPAPA
jgi:hypothetical protein